jgi:hypothetical protein
MTKEEALIHLKIDDGNDVDLEEVFEELFFEIKKELLTKPILPKVYYAKIKRLRKIEEAYVFLTGINFESNKNHLIEYNFSNQNEILIVIDYYYSIVNKFKIAINTSTTVDELEGYLLELISLQFVYAKKWPILLEEKEIIKVSMEPDAMLFRSAIKEIKETGINFFNDISILNTSEIVINEVKRLNLWLKMNNHGF